MYDNTIVLEKVRKEKKDNNILHFDSDLADYFPNGEIFTGTTLMNHLKREYYDLCYKNYHPSILKQAFICKSYKTYQKDNETYYIYKFDNELEIQASSEYIHAAANILSGVLGI